MRLGHKQLGRRGIATPRAQAFMAPFCKTSRLKEGMMQT